MSQIKNTGDFQTFLKERIVAAVNESLTNEAEPIIQKALADIEHTMREKLASELISRVAKSYDIEFDGNIIKILVRRETNG